MSRKRPGKNLSYRVPAGANYIAIRRDGTLEDKVAEVDKDYAVAQADGEWLVFPLRYHIGMRVKRSDVVVVVPTDAVSIPNGTYKTGIGGSDSTDLTIQVETNTDHVRGVFFEGKQIVSFRLGEGTLVKCMHIDEHGGVHLWKPFRDDSVVQECRAALLNSSLIPFDEN